MKHVDLAFSLGLLALACLQGFGALSVVTGNVTPLTTLFAAGALILLLTGLLNLLRATSARPRLLLILSCVFANVSVAAFILVSTRVQAWDAPLVLSFVGVVALAAFTMASARAVRATPAPAPAVVQQDEPLRFPAGGDPLDPSLHLQLAQAAARRGRHYLALAELKSAAFLGTPASLVAQLEPVYRAALPAAEIMNHNQYHRFTSLAQEVTARSGGDAVSVLDVGGGEGALAAFLPATTAYCLAEPAVNGISGTRLPFAAQSFDYVVACHVLEHVVPSGRAGFLEQLLARSRRGVILLNPFVVEGTLPEERLKLVIDVSDSAWAKEHLECTLPLIGDVTAFAAARGLQCEVSPNGCIATSLALFFMDHFAAASGSTASWQKVNAFFNRHYGRILTSAEFPTAYVIWLGLPAGAAGAKAPALRGGH